MDTRSEEPAQDGESHRTTIIKAARQWSAPPPPALERASADDADHAPGGRHAPTRERPDHEKTKKALVKEIAELRAYAAELEAALAEKLGDDVEKSHVVEFPVRKPERDTGSPAPSAGEMEAQRKQAYRYVRHQFELLRAITDSLGEGVYALDHTGKVSFINSAALSMLGYEKSELLYRDMHEKIHYLHPDGTPYPVEECPLIRAMTTGEKYRRAEDVFIRSDGSMLPVSYVATPVFADGATSGVVVAFHDISERKRLEEDLRSSERIFRILFEQAAVGISQVDTHGRYLLVNQRYCDITGYTPSELQGRRFQDITYPDDVEENTRGFAALVAKGVPVYATEKRFTRKDGSIVWVSITVTPVYGAFGELVYLNAVVEDINERKRLEHEIAQLLVSERNARRDADARASEMETIFNAMADGVVLYDAQGNMRQINPAGWALLALDRQPDYFSHPGRERSWQLHMRDEDGRQLRPEEWPYLRLLSGETLPEAKAVDVLTRNLAGEDRNYSYSGAPLRDAEGRIVGAVMVFRDVTERRRLEQRTRDALTALLEMAEAIVQEPVDIAVPPDGPVAPEPEITPSHMANSVAVHLARLLRTVLGCQVVSITALAPNQISLRPVAAVGLTPEMERQWWNDLRRSTPADYFVAEDLAPLARGELVIRDLAVKPFRNRSDYGVRMMALAPMRIGENLLGAIGIEHRDSTHAYTDDEIELILAAAKLAAVVVERERLVREREEAYANELALREVNRRMDEFLSIASHELKTPLTSILLTFHLLHSRMRMLEAAGGDVPAQQRLLQTVRAVLDQASQQGARMNRLVDDLLDVSRIRMNRFDLRAQICDLVAIVREAVREQEMHHPSRTLTLDLPPGEMPVMADGMRIGQVVTNYLTNALKYAPEDQPIAVSLRREGSDARVTVRDLGPGLTHAEQQAVWERFHRADSIGVVSGSEVGLGLGLYICRTIVERHGGQVGVEGAPGEGSSFWFTLPLLG